MESTSDINEKSQFAPQKQKKFGGSWGEGKGRLVTVRKLGLLME